MEAIIPKVANPKPLVPENIIDFVRPRNRASKHLDLFPDDINAIRNTGYGRAILNHRTYTFDVVKEQNIDILRVMIGDPNKNTSLPVINTFILEEGKAYSLWTMNTTGSTYVYIGTLEVPEDIIAASAWALGLVSKNRVSLKQLCSLFISNQEAYTRKHLQCPSLPADAYKPQLRKFSSWLAGTWVADKNGNGINAKVTWAKSNDIEPTFDEAVEMLDRLYGMAFTESARSRINFVKSVLLKREQKTGES